MKTSSSSICVEINVSIEKGKTNEAFTPRYQCNEVVDLENDGETPEVEHHKNPKINPGR